MTGYRKRDDEARWHGEDGASQSRHDSASWHFGFVLLLDVAFFTNRRFVAALCQTNRSVPSFQQHLLTLCVCHTSVILFLKLLIADIFVTMNCKQWS